MQTTCPECKKSLRVADGSTGKVRCPACSARFTVGGDNPKDAEEPRRKRPRGEDDESAAPKPKKRRRGSSHGPEIAQARAGLACLCLQGAALAAGVIGLITVGVALANTQTAAGPAPELHDARRLITRILVAVACSASYLAIVGVTFRGARNIAGMHGHVLAVLSIVSSLALAAIHGWVAASFHYARFTPGAGMAAALLLLLLNGVAALGVLFGSLMAILALFDDYVRAYWGRPGSYGYFSIAAQDQLKSKPPGTSSLAIKIGVAIAYVLIVLVLGFAIYRASENGSALHLIL